MTREELSVTPNDDIDEEVDELAAQLEHADRLITELMDRVDALEAELAACRLNHDANETAA
jgi:hypothetical protein